MSRTAAQVSRRDIAAFLAGALAVASAVGGIRLDDSTSPRPRVPAVVTLDEAGRLLQDSPFASTAQIRFGRIDYRLATAPYLGKRARVYYVVPPLIEGLRSPSALRVDWRGLGQLTSGSGRPGERHLVWSGVIAGLWLEESLELTAWVDLKQLRLPANKPFAFECFFEIDVTP